MTKRWLSLVLVLTLMSSLFTGVAMAAPGDKVVEFVPTLTNSDVNVGDQFLGKSIGYFLVDGIRPVDSTVIAVINGNLTVTLGGAAVPGKFVNGSAELLVTTGAFAAGDQTLSVSATGNSITGYDFSSFTTPKTVTLTGVKAATGLKNIEWVADDATVPGVVKQTNTVQVGVTTTIVSSAITKNGLKAELVPADANATVVWTSNDESILTVAADASLSSTQFAKITAKKAGSVTVTAKTKDGKFSRSMNITVVNVPATSVAIDDATPKAGQTTPLALTWTTTTPTDKAGTWSIVKAETSAGLALVPDSVATIDATTGVLTAKVLAATNKVWVRFVANAKDENGQVVKSADKVLTIGAADAKAVAPTATYTLGDAEPKAMPVEATTYKGTIMVTLTSATVGAKIYYTLDGIAPDKDKTPYTVPFSISADNAAGLKAIAYLSDDTNASETVLTIGAITIDPAITGLTLAADAATVNGSDEVTVKATMAGITGVVNANGLKNTWVLTGDTTSFTLTPAATDESELERTIQATAAAKDGDTVKLTVTNKWDTTKKAELTFTYKAVPVTGITLDKSSASVAANGQVVLKATLVPANASANISGTQVKWTSSNLNAAKFAADALTAMGETATVIGKSTGYATITATVGENGKTHTATCFTTVTAPTTKIAAPVFTVEKDTDGNNAKVFITSATQGAAVKYTVAESPAASLADPTASSDAAPVGGIALDSASSPTLGLNKVWVFKAIALPTVSTPSASLNNSDVVTFTVDSTVALKSVKIEHVASTGLSYDKATDTLTITGKYSLSSLADKLSATFTPGNANDKAKAITWSSSNESVVKVKAHATNPTASIESLAQGNAVITVTTKDGITDTINVVVKPVPVSSVSVAKGVTTGSFNLPLGIAAELTATVELPTVLNKKVAWTSNKPNVVSVDTDGRVVAKAYDVTTPANNVAVITATAEEKDANGNPVFGTITVTVVAAPPNVQAVDVYVKDPETGDLSTASGSYTVETEFVLKTATDGATIVYTTDGSEPSKTNGTPYTGSFKLSETTTIKAFAYKENLQQSSTMSHAAIFTLKVTEITVSKDTVEIEAFDKATVNFDYLPAKAVTGKTASVTVEDGSIATAAVDTFKKTVTINGLKPGTTKVTLSNGASPAITKVITVTVKQIAGLGIEVIGGNSVTMGIGDVKTLLANVNPNKVTQGVTWALSAADKDTDVVTLAGAVLQANKAGTVKLTVTADFDKTTKEEVTVVVKADPEVVPALPVNVPVFTAKEKAFTALVGEKLTAVVGTLAGDGGETYDQITYYYNVSVMKVSGVPNPVFSIDDQGVVTMTIQNVGTTALDAAPFSYRWALTPKANRTGNTALVGEYRTIGGNTLTVIEKPTAITYADNTPATYEVPGTTGSVDMGTIGNRADFAATGVALTATVDATRTGDAPKGTVAGFSASVGTDGKVTLNINNVATGVYDVFVTVSAEGCADVKTGTVAVTVKEAPKPVEKKMDVESKTAKFITSYKSKPVWVLNITDNTVTFSVPGNPVKSWKSSKPKLLKIDAASGAATLVKGGATRITVTATLEDGTKLTQLVVIRKMADTVKLQYKSGKKWVEFSESNPMVVGVGAKKKVLTRVVVVTPAKSKIIGGAWLKVADESIAFRGSKGYIVGVTPGTTSITYEAHNGIRVTGNIVVDATKAAEPIEEIETEVIEPIEEIEEIEEIVEVEEIPEIAAE